MTIIINRHKHILIMYGYTGMFCKGPPDFFPKNHDMDPLSPTFDFMAKKDLFFNQALNALPEKKII